MEITCATLDRAGLFPRVCCATCHDLSENGLRVMTPEGRSKVTVQVCCDRYRALHECYDDSLDHMSRNAWARFLWGVKLGMESEP